MNDQRRSKILFLFSDTGGGHRSAAEAIIEAMRHDNGENIDIEMVDFLKEYAPPPFRHFPETYPNLVKNERAWKWGFRLLDGRLQISALTGVLWPYVRQGSKRLIENHPADLIVSIHPLANAPALRALRNGSSGRTRTTPYITVVIDLVSTHAYWFHRSADLTIVSTPFAYQNALRCGIQPEKVIEIGFPVPASFYKPNEAPSAIRARLGWPENLPMVLLVGGGDGLGKLETTARAIDQAGLEAGLAIVTGRNVALRSRLEAMNWTQPTFVYGFVKEMAALTRASKILVSKAGPATISEGLNIGLPIVLYSFLPGQEEGNVAFLIQEGAGKLAQKPETIAAALKDWLSNPDSYHKAVQAAKRLARPESATRIAQILMDAIQEDTELSR